MTADRCGCGHQRATHESGVGRCWWACGCPAYRSAAEPLAVAEPRCPLYDLPTSGCAHCSGHNQPAPTVDELGQEDVLTVFTARFNQSCDHCAGPIHRGDPIAALVDGSGYACERCLP